MLENYVTSFIEGRIRLRHPALKDSQIVTQLLGFLENMQGIDSLKHNINTGSLLLEYDPTILDEETLIGLLEQGEQWLMSSDISIKNSSETDKANKKTCKMTSREKRKLANRAMTLALAMTVAGLGIGNKRIHVVAGSVFLGLSLLHLKRIHKALL